MSLWYHVVGVIYFVLACLPAWLAREPIKVVQAEFG